MRLIDADGLMRNNLCGMCGCTYWDPVFCPNCKYYEVRFMIEAAPTIEAEPVRHGQWVHHNGGYSDHFECTACGEDIVLTGKWRFCPNCGAKMDGGTDNG